MDVLAGARQLYMCFFPGAISFNDKEKTPDLSAPVQRPCMLIADMQRRSMKSLHAACTAWQDSI